MTNGLDYEDTRSNLLALVDPVAVPEANFLGQTGYNGELYAYVAWETGGTFWDFDAIKDWPTEATDLFVKDTFDKIATQVANFSAEDFGDNFAIDSFQEKVSSNIAYLGDFDDVVKWIDTRKIQEEPTTSLTDEQLAKFDLDNDGSLDNDDIQLLVESIFRGLMGDVDWDGYVNQADLSIVGNNWLDEDTYSWMLGDLNGNGIVDAQDMNFVGQNFTDDVWGP